MDRQYTQGEVWRRIAVVAIVGFAIAALLYKLDVQAGHGCNLLSGAAWFVLQILHPVLVAGWQSVQAYIPENTRLVQHLPDLVAFIRPLLCCVPG